MAYRVEACLFKCDFFHTAVQHLTMFQLAECGPSAVGLAELLVKFWSSNTSNIFGIG